MNNVNKWKLLEPIKVGTMWLRNRIVMAPMCSRLARPDGSVTKGMIDYYSERAKGGVGIIIVEASYIDNKESRGSLSSLGVYSDHLIAGLNELAEAIKSNGAAAILQICHFGRQCDPGAHEGQVVAPSAIPSRDTGLMPRELTLAEIEEIQNAFTAAARRVKQAGFNGVEIHCAHGYLIGEFLSPCMNRRADKYGGDLENRALFALETIAKVREEAGREFIVGCRMNADDYIPAGLTLGESSRFAGMLESAGVDYVSVSGGVSESVHHAIPPAYIERAHLVHLAESIKRVVTIPVITAGAHSVHSGEDALRTGKADLVALGRSLIADPELPRKLVSDRVDDIRPCIRGNEGCISRYFRGVTMRCEVNPSCGRENEFGITQAAARKNVLVIGGGIAGMETARVAALRGHEVTLVEKGERLGGHLIEASVPKFKQELKQLLNWATNQVCKGGAKVQLDTEATPGLIKRAKPDVLIVAVGSEYIVPLVPGKDKSLVVVARDVLLGQKTVGAKVVVIGGGIVGCETALYVGEELKKKVTIIARRHDILVGIENLSKIALTERLQKVGVEIYCGWELKEITDGGVVCEDRDWQRHEVAADTVIIAKGLELRKEMVEKFTGLASEVHVIGDCADARKIYNAFEDAWRTALML